MLTDSTGKGQEVLESRRKACWREMFGPPARHSCLSVTSMETHKLRMERQREKEREGGRGREEEVNK